MQPHEKINKNDPVVRLALHRCYDGKCALTGELILDDLDIDHIVPVSLRNEPVKLKQHLMELGLPESFELDSLLNLVPVKRRRNIQKGNRVTRMTMFLLDIASTKAARVLNEIRTIKQLMTIGQAKEVIRGYLHKGGVDSEAFVEALYDTWLEDEQPYPDELDFWRMDGVTYCVISKSAIRLEAKLPSIQRPSGSCRIRFRSLKARNTLSTLNHADITQRLFDGLNTAPEHELRGFFVSGLQSDGGALVQLGRTQLPLKSSELSELCSIVDELAAQYIRALREIDERLGSRQFTRARHYERGYRLVQVKRVLWDRMIAFANRHDVDHGRGPWHMFDANQAYVKVFTKEWDTRFQDGYHVFLHPEPVAEGEPWSFRRPDEDVWVVAEVLTDPFRKGCVSVDPRGYWDVATAYNWLTEQLIPAVISFYGLQTMRRRLFARSIDWLSNRIWHKRRSQRTTPLYQDGQQQLCPHPSSVGTLRGLREYVEFLQYHHNHGGHMQLDASEVASLYNAVALCLYKTEYHDHHYVEGNLRFKVDWASSEATYQSIQRHAATGVGGVYAYLTVDCALRCIVVALREGRSHLTPREIEQIAGWLSPYYERLMREHLLQRASPYYEPDLVDWTERVIEGRGARHETGQE